MQDEELVTRLGQAILDKKGFNILALDVRGISSMTDYFLIAEGNVERHVQALAREVKRVLDESGIAPSRIEGFTTGQWIVIDCWGVVVHLFTPAMRNQFRIERVWEKGKVLDLDLNVGIV